jgi:Tol biopolymer transport system component/imidazolonepropionase-like amidohydrolase
VKTRTAIVILGAVLFTPAVVLDQAAYRTIELKTTEVTAPALTLSPDGRLLFFSALGHLYQLAVTGGATTQLTFGPWYDFDPAISPDGRRVAFASNRDGSGSNIFVLDLASKSLTQLTHDVESARPAWSPDGQTIAYARNLAREDHPIELMPGFADNGLREVRTMPATGGPSNAIGPPKTLEALFYLPDGRLAWTVTERNPGGGMFQTIKQTRIEAGGPGGSISVLATVGGDPGRVVPGPRGDGIYFGARGSIQWLPFGTNVTPTQGPRIQDGFARLSVSRDGATIYFGDRGHLWRVTPLSGTPERIAFTALMTLEVRPPLRPRWQAPAVGSRVPIRPVLSPAVSPDGKRVVFMAAGFLWEQPIGGGAAQPLFESGAFARDPAFSPDGRKLAFVASEHGKRDLRVYDFATRKTDTLYQVGGSAWPLYPSWSPDGQRIVFQHTTGIFDPYRLMVVKVDDGTTEQVARSVGAWTARPHFSGDSRTLYYTSRVGKVAALYRIAARGDAQPEQVTDLTRHVHEGLVSPDGKWMALRRNSGIWIAPMGPTPIRETQLRRFSANGGRSFSFMPDSSAIIYGANGKIWRQPIATGQRVEVPIRVTLPRPLAPPLLIQRVRVLDLEAGRFGDETSMFIEGGRIRWIGREQERQVPASAVRIDASGRFAIPGLFDSHVHSAWSNQQANEDAFIAFGITSVRDTGGTIDLLTALDARSNDTALPAPRYFYSGEIFEGLMPHWGDAFLQIGTSEEARAEVRNWKASDADFVKVYPSLPWHLQQVVADEAYRVGLPLVGHGLSPEEVTRHIILGFSSLEHSSSVAYEDILELAAAAGTSIDPTLNVGNGALMRANEPDWESSWRVQEFVPEEARRTGGSGRGGGPGVTVEQLRARAKPQFDRLVRARQSGVNFLGGTDSLMGGVYFGLSLHWEIAQFVDAGFTPIDVLRMATQGAADQVGAGAEVGSLTPGKLADIVLLEANPLENVRNTQTIWQVVKGGRVFDPTKLRPGVAANASEVQR